MYTIAYDETSNFEVLRTGVHTEEPAMIAGVLFKDTSSTVYKKNNKVTEPERERVIRYYEEVCKKVGTAFPWDLHVNYDQSNNQNVKKTKEEVTRTIGEFLKYGTYRGKELLFADEEHNIVEKGGSPLKREGTYSIIAVMHTDSPVSDAHENILRRDDIASNLYSNMVQEYLKKSIFLNLAIEEERPVVTFNIPSRHLKKSDVEGQENYNHAGYGTHKITKTDGKETHLFVVIDSGYIRALINELDNFRKIELKDLNVKSINYNPNQALKQAYLYLSDSVCTVLSFKNSKPYDKDIRKRMNSINHPQNNMFFYYEGLDDHYDKAVEAMLNGDIFTALSELYDGRYLSSPEVKEYYRKKWYSLIEKKILKMLDGKALKDAIEALDRYRYSDNLVQKKLLYIHSFLEKAGEKVDLEDRYKFKLADIGISAYTHIGDPLMAEHYYKKCGEYEDAVDHDEAERIRIRYITTLNDFLMFEIARDYALDLLGINIKRQPEEPEKKRNFVKRAVEKLLTGAGKKAKQSSETEQLLRQMPEKVTRPNMYKALSSLGQTYAFLNDPLAEYCFLKSIQDIKYAPDSSITQSFLLHRYIECGDEENYSKCASDYFAGRQSLNDQLTYLIEEGSKSREESPRFSLGYAMFVFIKAYYKFYKDIPENRELTKKLVYIEETIGSIVSNGKNLMKDHPWEIIYKYSAMLARDIDDENASHAVSKNKKSAKTAVGSHPGNIIRRVLDFGDIELLSQELHSDSKLQKYHRSINALWSDLYKDGLFLQRNPEDTTVEEKLVDLKHLFTYMYH